MNAACASCGWINGHHPLCVVRTDCGSGSHADYGDTCPSCAPPEPSDLLELAQEFERLGGEYLALAESVRRSLDEQRAQVITCLGCGQQIEPSNFQHTAGCVGFGPERIVCENKMVLR